MSKKQCFYTFKFDISKTRRDRKFRSQIRIQRTRNLWKTILKFLISTISQTLLAYAIIGKCHADLAKQLHQHVELKRTHLT